MNISIKHKAPTSLARRLAVLATLLLALGAATSAQAQWQVTDTEQDDNTGQTAQNTQNISKQLGGSTSGSGTDTVNGHLKNIDTVGTTYAPASSSSAVTNPDVALPTPPTPDLTPCGGVANPQQSNCQQIINMQASQYKYMKAMYDKTQSREQDLQALVNARQSIQAENYGLLMDNTNKIEALRAQIEIDHQQMISINLAYNNYISYLQNQQTLAAKSAASPGSNSLVGNTLAQITSGAILGVALATQSDGKPLSIEGDNGF